MDSQTVILAGDKIGALRDSMRDDVSYIDNASAVLSAGNGKAFSIRSGALSRFSVTTPLTFD